MLIQKLQLNCFAQNCQNDKEERAELLRFAPIARVAVITITDGYCSRIEAINVMFIFDYGALTDICSYVCRITAYKVKEVIFLHDISCYN